MEKREKVIIGVSIISIIAIIYIVIAVDFIEDKNAYMEEYEYMRTFDDPDEIKVREELKSTYKETYDDIWDYGHFWIEDEEHEYGFNIDYEEREIEAEFTLKVEDVRLDDSVMESMPEICNTVKTVINEYLGEEYALYPVRIIFGEMHFDTYDDGFIAIEYTDDTQIMKISIEDSNVTLSKIVEVFPDVNEIETTKLHYDSIGEISGFYDLKKIDVSNKFTEEEKEYILSIYPDCQIMNNDYSTPEGIYEVENHIESLFESAAYEDIIGDSWSFESMYLYDDEYSAVFGYYDNEQVIEVCFVLNDKWDNIDNNAFESIPLICERVLGPLYSKYLGYDTKEEYLSYPVYITFKAPYYDNHSITMIYEEEGSVLKIYSDTELLSLKTISELFPETNEIEAVGFCYDNIEEINGFDNLQSIKVLNSNYAFTEDEKEYILSLYPDCEIY